MPARGSSSRGIRSEAEIPATFLAAYDTLLDRWPVSVETIDVPTPFGVTRVNACGPVDAPALVLLHGGGATAASWFANAAGLSRRHRVYAVDRVGEAGRSVRTPDARTPASPADLAEGFGAVLDGLGVTTAALCGHSYGARLALDHALTAPDRVRALVLLDPTQTFAGLRPGYLAHAVPMLLRPTSGRVRGFLEWECGGLPDADWVELFTLGATVYPAAKPIVGPRPSVAALGAIAHVPTLLVTAGRSRAHDPARVAAAARRAMPHAEVTTLTGVSHHQLPFTDAETLDRMTLDFLDRLD